MQTLAEQQLHYEQIEFHDIFDELPSSVSVNWFHDRFHPFTGGCENEGEGDRLGNIPAWELELPAPDGAGWFL